MACFFDLLRDWKKKFCRKKNSSLRYLVAVMENMSNFEKYWEISKAIAKLLLAFWIICFIPESSPIVNSYSYNKRNKKNNTYCLLDMKWKKWFFVHKSRIGILFQIFFSSFSILIERAFKIINQNFGPVLAWCVRDKTRLFKT